MAQIHWRGWPSDSVSPLVQKELEDMDSQKYRFRRHKPRFVLRRLRERGHGARRLYRLDAIVLSGGRALLLGPACVPLIGFVAADDASCNNADFAVPCHMARDATDDSALDTSLCLSGGRDKRYPQNRGAKDQRLHGGSPKNHSLQQAGLG